MKTSPNTHSTPDQPKSGRPEKERCLEELITALLSCHENYNALSMITQSGEGKATCKRYADERTNYAYTLYSSLGSYNQIFVDETGTVRGFVNPVWSNVENAIVIEAVDIFPAVITSELEAIKKYDTYLRNHIPIIPHLRLLTSQKNSIKQTVKYLSESINLC
ncbi:hypothetical protein ACPPVU_00785 [Mucilaginibacter sp. McL0603]|uniref:hypothetical protein n=1 Tax=Mucilaginibacter sp. McL0603 TaxID=3415670 RepID=UPI003CEDCC6A